MTPNRRMTLLIVSAILLAIIGLYHDYQTNDWVLFGIGSFCIGGLCVQLLHYYRR